MPPTGRQANRQAGIGLAYKRPTDRPDGRSGYAVCYVAAFHQLILRLFDRLAACQLIPINYMYPVLTIRAVDTETAIATAAMEIAVRFYKSDRYIDDKVIIAASLKRSYIHGSLGSVLDTETGKAWVVSRRTAEGHWDVYCITHP